LAANNLRRGSWDDIGVENNETKLSDWVVWFFFVSEMRRRKEEINDRNSSIEEGKEVK